MRSAIFSMLLALAASAGAETVIINRSVTSGRVDIGPNAHTGSIVIDGTRVEKSGTSGRANVDAAKAKVRVGKQLDQARLRVFDQLDRLQGKP
jgi:hypothetical protein